MRGAIDLGDYQSLWSELLTITRRFASTSDAEDAAAEAIMAALRKPGLTAIDRRWLPWLVITARNKLRNGWKRKRPDLTGELELHTDPRSLKSSVDHWLEDWLLHLGAQLGQDGDRETVSLLRVGATLEEIADHRRVSRREVQRSVVRVRRQAMLADKD